MKLMKNALVILAGGKGTRFGGNIPKQFQTHGNSNFIQYFLFNLKYKFDLIVISCSQINRKKYLKNINNYYKFSKLIFSKPGCTRQESSFNALKKIKVFNPKNVLIHDAARPLCSNNLIFNIIKNLNKYKIVIPYIDFTDRKINFKGEELNCSIKFIQTPQGFKYKSIYNLHKKEQRSNLKDDSSLFNTKTEKIKYIKGEKFNIKITQPEDLILYKYFKKTIYKSGIGYDIHKIDTNTKKGLKLCGINIPFSKLIGHSDADVGFHAICDSIFGALSMRDIGFHFPNTNIKWKNKNSKEFILFAKKKLKENNYFIVNLDLNIICEKPNISKYQKKC